MPPLSKHTRDIRILQVMEATRLMASGVNKTSACEQAGLSIRQYDYWLARDNGAIAALQKVIIEAERVWLADITNAYAIILGHLLREVMQPGIDPLLALKALKYLDCLKERLEKKHGVNSATDAAETYLLKGPTLRIEESIMASIKVTANPDGSASLQLPFSK
jgi:hypothetical protein